LYKISIDIYRLQKYEHFLNTQKNNALFAIFIEKERKKYKNFSRRRVWSQEESDGELHAIFVYGSSGVG